VNVAITRAKSKLLILGSKGTLGGCGNETLEGLVKLMEGKEWVLNLPQDAAEGHIFDGAALATQSPTKNVDGVDRLGRRSPRKQGVEEVLSPSKKRKVGSLPPFKQPLKLVNGSLAQAERALGRSGIMRDIVNGI
jgi:DNA replication ATP-dependent helicase Dna2